MNDITLRAPGTRIDSLPLAMGMHAIGRAADGTFSVVDDPATARACFCVDRRGVWLVIGDGVRGVHVNGRPVQRKAMLRKGDSVHLDGQEIVLCSAQPAMAGPGATAATTQAEPDPRVVLRGIGGRNHGRSFTLDRSRLIGSATDVDIRIDESAVAARHARIGLNGGRVALQMLDAGATCQVNGEAHRDAWLQPGDQVAFDSNHRFVVEAPLRDWGLPLAEGTPEAVPGHVAAIPATRRLPWLLLAALLLAAAMSALLLL